MSILERSWHMMGSTLQHAFALKVGDPRPGRSEVQPTHWCLGVSMSLHGHPSIAASSAGMVKMMVSLKCRRGPNPCPKGYKLRIRGKFIFTFTYPVLGKSFAHLDSFVWDRGGQSSLKRRRGDAHVQERQTLALRRPNQCLRPCLDMKVPGAD